MNDKATPSDPRPVLIKDELEENEYGNYYHNVKSNYCSFARRNIKRRRKLSSTNSSSLGLLILATEIRSSDDEDDDDDYKEEEETKEPCASLSSIFQLQQGGVGAVSSLSSSSFVTIPLSPQLPKGRPIMVPRKELLLSTVMAPNIFQLRQERPITAPQRQLGDPAPNRLKQLSTKLLQRNNDK